MIQGATEFFPVSSSAHLVIAQNYLGVREPARTLAAFDIFLHFGTLMAAIYYFRWDLAWLFGIWIKPLREKLRAKNPPSFFEEKTAKKVGPLIILGILPAAFVGAMFHQFFEDLFSDTMMVSLLLMVTGMVIYTTKKIQGNTLGFAQMNAKQALLIGLAQIFSILPGISRSGTTIACGLFVKLKPEVAFRFSFLMIILLVASAFCLELSDLQYLEWDLLMSAICGTVTAAVAGYVCVGIMFKLMVQNKFPYFAYYCWIVGSLVLFKEMFF